LENLMPELTIHDPNAGEPLPPVGPEESNAVHSIFIGPNGLRAGWRLLIFVGIFLLLLWATGWVMRDLLPPPRTGIVAWNFLLLREVVSLGCVLLAAFVMSRIEHRDFGQYGLPGRRAFGRNFWVGCIWGAVSVTVLIVWIWAAHGYSFGTVALHGKSLAFYSFTWLVGFIFVGLFEEFTTRGYAQFTLTTGIGFWPAAVILSGVFGGLHLSNPGEAWVGGLSAGLIGLFFALTLRRTGDLWFAVGFHALFDYGETFAFSVPNSGIRFPGVLLNSSFHGPRWITGGSVGPEGSVFIFVLIGALFVVFDRVYRKVNYPAVEKHSVNESVTNGSMTNGIRQ
jgi:membrane protease YdiL (CAAX protease family)